MKKLNFFVLVLLLCALPREASAQVSTFSRNLSIGDSGQDVLELQRLLNQDSKTQITVSGAGSPGNETMYFGHLTHQAVIRFQNLYAAEILYPVGLFQGTGFVGPSTRTKLSSMLVLSNQPITSTPVDQSPQTRTISPTKQSFPSGFTSAFQSTSDELVLGYPSEYEGAPGTAITLFGNGFAKTSNTVYFGSHAIKNVSSPSGSTLSVTVPDIAYGKYDLEVHNGKKKTDTDAFFVIKDVATPPPTITGITPTKGVYGTKVTITGTGFTSNNELRTSYGVFDDISSKDGKTISLEIEPYPEAFGPDAEEITTDRERVMEISIYVVNDNGVSKERAIFKVSF